MKSIQARLLVGIACAVAIFFLLDFDRWLTLAQLKANFSELARYHDTHPVLAGLFYGTIYIIVTGLSLPGATVLTLAGGALFGLLIGTIIVSFASTIGATLAFLASRYLLRDWVKTKLGLRFAAIEAGFAKEGAYYLFSLRLVPLFPFFAINLAMGLTNIKTTTFYWVSQIGMLAGTVVYVNAGTQLASLKSTADILSPPILGAFVLLGLFPLAAKKLLVTFRNSNSS